MMVNRRRWMLLWPWNTLPAEENPQATGTRPSFNWQSQTEFGRSRMFVDPNFFHCPRVRRGERITSEYFANAKLVVGCEAKLNRAADLTIHAARVNFHTRRRGSGRR